MFDYFSNIFSWHRFQFNYSVPTQNVSKIFINYGVTLKKWHIFINTDVLFLDIFIYLIFLMVIIIFLLKLHFSPNFNHFILD